MTDGDDGSDDSCDADGGEEDDGDDDGVGVGGHDDDDGVGVGRPLLRTPPVSSVYPSL